MDRRAFARALVVAMTVRPEPARAAQSRSAHRLGYLSPAGVPLDQTTAAHLVPAALRDLGHIEGQNLVVERRFADGKLDRLPALARDLEELRVEVIVSAASAAVQAALDATRLPIVMFAAVDPLAKGWVKSLARPGGRVTGVVITPDTHLAAKRLGLLREAVPRATRIAVLTTDEPVTREQAEATRRSATAGVTVAIVEVRQGAYERAFEEIAAGGARALVVVPSAILNRDRKQIIALVARHRLPAIYQWRQHPEDGGLMSYGSDIGAMARRAAGHVDRIFKGTPPSDIPIEQPSTYELVINQKTARDLGLTLPATLLTRADRLIQ